ncbi:hypothetical protein B0H39_003318 [Clostridium beijerinckii]|uniref:hypothetical protein n=1 Tax=Clostridium beijerinckii TaxID=1520 RepID=UPI001493E75F|nr:hypothetical protein [Clostridium beijerinckii]NOW85437.1 hypothetical protein [Clostridium beijerinckii]
MLENKKKLIIFFIFIIFAAVLTFLSAMIDNEEIVPSVLIILICIIVTIMSIKIKNLDIYILVLLPIFYITIKSIFKVDIIRYAIDYFCFIILIKSICKRGYSKYWGKRLISILNILFMFVLIIGLIINDVNFYIALNGLWEYLKYFIVFWYVANFNIDEKTMKKVNKLVIGLNFIQLPITIIQYFLRIDRDAIGGLFRNGGTGVLMVFNFWSICYFTAKLKNKEIKFLKYFIYICILVFPSIINEAKATFLILPIIFIYIFYETKLSIRNWALICVGIISSIFFMKLLIVLYPSFSTLFTDKDYFITYTFTGTYSTVGLNRFNAISYMLNYALMSYAAKLFGIGVGQGTPSNYEIFTGNFYRLNSNLFYEWFQAPYMILESGILGLVVYILIILTIVFICKKVFRNKKNAFVLGGGAFALVHVINVFYNQILFDYYGAFFWTMMGLILNMSIREANSSKKINICSQNNDKSTLEIKGE